jgi:hypothetical protein
VTLIALDSKGTLRSWWTSPPNEKNWTALVEGNKPQVALPMQDLSPSALATAQDFDSGFQRAFVLSKGSIHEFDVARDRTGEGKWPLVGSVTW